MGREAVIQIEGLKKQYKLGQIGGGTLQGDLQSWWARVRGKEDPNTKIGADQRSNGKTFMALNGIDLTVYRGEALGIIGHNGAGKSTLLKILSRVTAPTEGEVRLKGRVASMLEVGTGFNGEMTGRENIYMNGAILGMTKAEVDAKMEQIIDFSECREFIDTPVKRYSSGMYVKLAFSVAAHLDAEIMIMDEVLAVGDMKFQQKCLGRMGDAAGREGRTVLYVSHNMNTIRQLCTRCVVLDQGRVIFDGDVEEAIGIYMERNLQGNVRVNYTGAARPSFLRTEDVRLISAEYPGRESCVFGRGAPLNLRLEWENRKDIEHLGLRFEVKGADDVPLATSVCYDFYSGAKEARACAEFTYDLSMLAPGNYKTIYTLFRMNEFGTGEDVDCMGGLDIVIEDDTTQSLTWRAKYWGHVELPRPKVQIG